MAESDRQVKYRMSMVHGMCARAGSLRTSIVLVACALVFGACGDESTLPPVEIDITSILLEPDSVSLLPNDSMTLALSLQHVTRSEITLVSRDTSIARVNLNGIVKALGPGRTHVVARGPTGKAYDSTV